MPNETPAKKHWNPRFVRRLLAALTLLFVAVTGTVVSNVVAGTPDQGVNPSFISTNGYTRDVLVHGGFIYWSHRSSEVITPGQRQTRSIGRANLDGSNPNPNFIVLPASDEPFGGIPGGITTDGTYLYWTVTSDEAVLVGFVTKANLDGTLVTRDLVKTGPGPVGITAANGKLYWANADANTIGTANADGTGLNQSLVTNTVRPYGVRVVGSYLYYTNFGNGKTIGRSTLDGTVQEPNFLFTTVDPVVDGQGVTGIAADSTYLYWSNYVPNSDSTVGRYRLDGSTAAENAWLKGITPNTVKAPVGLAVTSTHLFWTSFEPKTIGRTEFDTAAPVLTVAPVNAIATALNTEITYPTPVTAVDINDTAPNITITCSTGDVKGGVFPVGVTNVTCTAKDAVGNTSSKSFDVTVAKPGAPTLNVPADIISAATTPSGIDVKYPEVTASAGKPTCDPASGSLFKVGVTTVTCTVSDDFDQTTTKAFTITVTVPTSPQVVVPANQTVTATSPAGAVVNYPAATSTAGTPTCGPASNTTFAIGTTKVSCTVTDAFGQVGAASFNVTVSKPAVPVVSVPATVEVITTGTSAVATFPAPTSAAGKPTCSVVSGSVFQLGSTTVTCRVTDGFGQTGTASFVVVVRPPVLIPVVQVVPDSATTTVAPTTAAPTAAAAATTVAPTSAAPTTAAPTTAPATVPAVEVAGITVTPDEAPAATPVNVEPSFAG